MANFTRQAKRLKGKGESYAAALSHLSNHVDFDMDAAAEVADVYGTTLDTEEDETAHASQDALDSSAEGSTMKNYEKSARSDLAAMTGYENYIQKEADSKRGKMS